MAQQKRSKGQRIFVGVIAVAFALLLWGSRDVLKDTFEVLKSLDTRFLFILPALHLTSYFFTSKYYQSMLAAFDTTISSFRMYTMIISLYFVEQALPSGGASGVTYIAYALRDQAKTGTVTLVQLGRYIFSFSSYLLVVLLGLVLLLVSDGDGSVGRGLLLGVPVFGAILMISIVSARLLSNRKRLNNFAKFLSRNVNKFGRLLNRIKLRSSTKDMLPQKKAIEEMNTFDDGVETLFAKRAAVIKPYLYMSASALLQVAIVYLAFVAVGESINPGYVIIAFTLANIVGVVSVVPGDVGVHEATMVFALNFMGVDSSIALSATLLYRIYNKMFVLILGFIFYSRFLKPAETEKEK